jgi:hypothetical protein
MHSLMIANETTATTFSNSAARPRKGRELHPRIAVHGVMMIAP